jgi:hypothetical protein
MSANRRERRKNKNRKKSKSKKDTVSKKDKIYGHYPAKCVKLK